MLKLVIIWLAPGLEWNIPGLENRTVQPGWLFRLVGPMQQGMLYSVGLILINYLTVLLNSQMFAKCCFCK